MSRQRVRHFLGRLTRLEYLGLHLAVGLVLCVGLVVAFAIVARQVDEAGALTRFDTRLGLRLTADRKATPLLRTGLMGLTYLSAFEFMLFFVPAVAVLLLLRRWRLLAGVWLIAAVGTSVLNGTLKQLYGRPRPPYKDPWVYENNQSFPSGHSSGSIVVFGMLAYLLVLRIRSRRARVATVAGFGLLILGIGFSRIYLGAHYFSDVIGGYCIGGAWLVACITAVEGLRLRAHAKASGGREPPEQAGRETGPDSGGSRPPLA